MEYDSLGDVMKRTATLLLACTAFGVMAQASAQSLSRGWDSYRQQQKQQVGTQGATASAAQSSRPAQAGTGEHRPLSVEVAPANPASQVDSGR